MTEIASIMIFAAGFGTRMRPLTATRPKPLVPLAGRPMIDRALELADAAGIPRKMVNAHYLAGQIVAHLAGRPDVEVIVEDPILETGGGLVNALPALEGDPIATLNPDALFCGPNPLRTLAAHWDGARMDALLLLVPPVRAVGHGGRGDFILREDVPGPLRRLSAGEDGLIHTGVQLISRRALAPFPGGAFSLNRIWDRLAADGRLFGLVHEGLWADIGTPWGLRLAEAMLEKGEECG